MDIHKPIVGPGMKPATPTAPVSPVASSAAVKKPVELPKCFGTDYFGKWNMTGMTFESMKIDNTEYQRRCAYCYYFERCYLCNHIRLLRIKR